MLCIRRSSSKKDSRKSLVRCFGSNCNRSVADRDSEAEVVSRGRRRGTQHLKDARSVDEKVRGAACLLTGAATNGLYLDLTWIHQTELHSLIQRNQLRLLRHSRENTLLSYGACGTRATLNCKTNIDSV